LGNNFGGQWTKKKLDILENYLNFYMQSLKNFKFKKIYIDCFAGSGNIKIPDNNKVRENTDSSGIQQITLDVNITEEDIEEIKGSTRIALDMENKFDKYYFIEKEKSKIRELEMLKQEYPNLDITIIKGDCNDKLPILLESIDWRYNRGVLFIDPYATQFKFETLREVTNTKAIDVWYLFPYSAINRMLTKSRKIDKSWENCIELCLGSNEWKSELYKDSEQINIFGEPKKEKSEAKEIQEYICKRMKSIFPYVSEGYMELKNGKNSVLFLLFLLISSDSQKVHALVKKVEKYILK